MTAVITITSVGPARVILQIVETGTGDARTNRIVRTDVNGTRNVRVADGKYPLSAGTHSINDYEAAVVSGTTVKWTAYTIASQASGTLTSPVWAYSGWAYLTCPTIPALGQFLAPTTPTEDAGIVVRYDDTRTAATTLHQVVGRADPIAILRPAGLPAGTFDVTYSSLAAAQNLRDMLARGYVWMLRQSDQAYLDFYFVVISTTLTHSDQEVRTSPRHERRWTLSVQYMQVAAPGPDIIALIGWTYAVVAASYTSYGALLGSFATYADLTTHHPS